ncbi:MAG: hypothetical protein AAGB51_03250 [Planctomycetota bacterium]
MHRVLTRRDTRAPPAKPGLFYARIPTLSVAHLSDDRVRAHASQLASPHLRIESFQSWVSSAQPLRVEEGSRLRLAGSPVEPTERATLSEHRLSHGRSADIAELGSPCGVRPLRDAAGAAARLTHGVADDHQSYEERCATGTPGPAGGPRPGLRSTDVRSAGTPLIGEVFAIPTRTRAQAFAIEAYAAPTASRPGELIDILY